MYHNSPRDRVLELVEEGLVSSDYMLMCCLKHMSHDDVNDMAEGNEICLHCGDLNTCTCEEE